MQGGLRFADKVVLTVAWLVTCGLVYLFGFYLGKGMQEVRYGREERVVRLPVESEVPPAGSPTAPRPAYEFYGDLAGTERRTSTRESTPERLVHGEDPPVGLGAEPAPRVVPVPPAPAKADADPGGDSTGRRSPAPGDPSGARPAGAAAARADVSGPSRGGAPGGRADLPMAGSAGRGWTVRTRPLPSQAEAEALRARLRARGYAAQVVQARREGAPVFVLVVGRYPSAGEAAAVMRKLRAEDGVTQAFVASE